MTPDLSRENFHKALRRCGFRVASDRFVSHPEISGGKALACSARKRRQALSDLLIRLREARARKRGGRFVTTTNSDWRVRMWVQLDGMRGAG